MGDKKIFHYCQVKFPNTKRIYSYMLKDESFTVGDTVIAPVGKSNFEKRGIIVAMGDYTEDTAPYPPELTKTIISKSTVSDIIEDSIEKTKTSSMEKTEVTEKFDEKPADNMGLPAEDKSKEKRTVLQKRLIIFTVFIILGICTALLGSRVYVQYRQAQDFLENRMYKAAGAELKKGYKVCEKELQIYTRVHRNLNVKTASSARLESVLQNMEGVAADYSGPFAEKFAAFRSSLPQLIADAKAREKAEADEKARRAEEARKAEEDRIAALKATGIPYVGMSEDEINSTWQLGKAGFAGSNSKLKKDATGHYYRDEWNVYAWYDTKGKIIFRAECKDGAVFKIEKRGETAWDGDKLLVKLGKAPKLQTFNYGGDSSYDGDTGAGSGHSLREEYDFPEDLYEDNMDDYDDWEEAYDEWEEGW